MKRIYSITLVLTSFWLSLPSFADPVGAYDGSPYSTWDSVADAGVEVRTFYQPNLIDTNETVLRRYLQYVPESVTQSKNKRPLVIALPGAGLSAELFREWDLSDRLERLADTEQFIIAYANAYADVPSDLAQANPDEPMFAHGGYWRTCFGKPGANEQFFSVDDVAYVRTVLDKMKDENLPIDLDRVYIMGMSNGGEMAQRLGRDMADEIAGFGAVMPVPAMPATEALFTCQAREQLPLAAMFIYSPGDSLLSPVFSSLGLDYADQMTLTKNAWRESLGIGEHTQRVRILPNRIHEGAGYIGDSVSASSTIDSQIYRYDYKRAKNGSRLAVLEILNGAGHAWPNASPTSVEVAEQGLNGFKNQDINAELVVWNFLKKQKRKCTRKHH